MCLTCEVEQLLFEHRTPLKAVALEVERWRHHTNNVLLTNGALAISRHALNAELVLSTRECAGVNVEARLSDNAIALRSLHLRLSLGRGAVLQPGDVRRRVRWTKQGSLVAASATADVPGHTRHNHRLSASHSGTTENGYVIRCV